MSSVCFSRMDSDSDTDEAICAPQLPPISEKIWVTCGLAGSGKTSLFNRLTGETRPTSNSANAVTTQDESIDSAATPTPVLKCPDAYMVDCEGSGSANKDGVKESAAASNIAYSRIISGASGVIICMEPETRSNIFDKLMILNLIALCGKVPVILCFTKCDKHPTYVEWIRDNIEDLKATFHLEQTEFKFATTGAGMDEADDALVELMAKYSCVVTKDIKQVRAKVSVEPALNTTREQIENLVIFMDDVFVALSAFDWWVNILSFVPFVGNIISIIRAIRNVIMGMHFGQQRYENRRRTEEEKK